MDERKLDSAVDKFSADKKIHKPKAAVQIL